MNGIPLVSVRPMGIVVCETNDLLRGGGGRTEKPRSLCLLNDEI